MIQGISEAIAASFFMVITLAFGVGFFVGWVVFLGASHYMAQRKSMVTFNNRIRGEK